ncbi:Ig-like domain-containing protein [uncultured Polaribacter sp.]|uniref:Ig-like domain-containing protein n=1 Tax=uncultured Polaribacter sp. TaxID=174711 RepID=UPI002608875A|nr:Ig-like domain-containing protein [uncultured Polaribacter sp.]
MKKSILLLALLFAIFTVNSQSVSLPQATINPAPLAAVENNGTGVAGFTFAESSGVAVPVESFPGIPNVTISVNLQYINLTGADINGITGTLLNYFSVAYNAGTNIMTFTQNAIIPGDASAAVSFPITVIQNSVQGDSFNGLNANINATDANTNAQGNAAVFTYTNSLPIAVDDPANVDEDDTINVLVLTNDTFGFDGPSTSAITITSAASNGTAVVNIGGTPNDPTDDTIDYTPTANFNGTDSFVYQICDINGDCDTATVNVVVAPVNDLPTAVNDPATVLEDQTVNVTVLTNDSFGGDGPSTGVISVTTAASNGTAVVNNGGTPNDPTDDTIDYTPNANYNGNDSFVYQICDSNGDCVTATVNVVITPVNDFPVATNDPVNNVSEDGTTNVAVLTNDSFGGDGPSTGAISITSAASNGSAVVNNGGTPNDPTDDTINYIPNANYNGPDSFVYQICDANGDCDTATVTMNVISVDDFPTANNDPTINVNEDSVNNNLVVLTNDDFGGDGPSTGTITITSGPSNGIASINNGGTPNDPTDDSITYTPTGNYNGPDSLIYQICDADGDCDTATVAINVIQVNDNPVANNDPLNVNEDSGLTNFPVLTNDSFGGDGPSTGTITITVAPTNGTAVVNNGGTPNDPTDDSIDFTPNGNYNGPDTIVYQICDANGDCDTATVNVTVTPVNDLPLATNDPATVNEDASVTVLVLTNDTFGGDGPSTSAITVTSAPSNGTAVVNNGGTPSDPTDDTIVYTPNANYFGADSFVYQICDLDGDCDTATVNVTVNSVDDFPTANADPATVLEDGTVNVTVLTNDSFGGDGPSTGTITIPTAPTNGTAVVNDGGTPNDPTDDTIDYTPNANYNGPDSFVYQICDVDGDCETATVNVTVTPEDDFPLAATDPTSVLEDSGLTNIPVLTNDSFGGDGPSTGTITITVTPTNGTAVVNDGGTPNDPTDDSIDFTPNADYNGPDSITYQICDVDGDCDTATIPLTVISVNDLPTAVNDPATINEDSANNNIVVLTNDDFGGDGPSTGMITITTAPTNGTAVVNNGGTPNDPTDDSVTYTPNSNYDGPDSLVYQICDANGDCATATVNITVADTTTPPVANTDPATVPEDGTVNVPVLTNDTFGSGLPAVGPITITTAPTNGTAVVDDGGTPNDPTDDTIDYTPNPDYNGPDSFVYQICNTDGLCDTATVNMTVTPVDDFPTANTDPVDVNEDSVITVPVLANDTFGGDGPSTGVITVTTAPTNGTAVVNNGGTPNDPTDDTITYIPNPNYNGPDSITYQICDADGDCDTATVDVTVISVNDLPLANTDPASVNEGATVNVPVLANDTFGGDGPSTGTITITTAPTNGTAVVNNGGTPNDPTDDTVVYTPTGNYNGPDSFVYQICDSNADCDTATVNVTVVPVNTLPVANTDPASVLEDQSVTVTVLNNDTFGGDGPSTGAITVTSAPANGTAVVNNGGTPNDPTDDTVVYTPTANYNGPDSFVYQICDANGDCDTATVNVSVTPVNDNPIANNDPVTVNEDNFIIVPVLTNDTFGPDGPSNGPITVTTPPTNGTAVVNDGGTPNDPTDDTVVYTPNPDYNGPDSFTYQICTINGVCDTATVNVTVTPMNDVPVAQNDPASVNEDASVNVLVLTNDSFGGDGPSTGTITVTSAPANGIAVVNNGGTANDPTDDTVVYTPNANYNGPDSFVYQICDANGDCDTATVNVSVAPVNDDPIANNDPVTVNEDTPINVTVLTNDTFGPDGPSNGPITITTPPTNGTAVVNDGGTPNDPTDDTVDYTPNPNYSGPDSFTYQICTATGVCDTATVNVTVTPVNEVPEANDDPVTINEDSGLNNIIILANDNFNGDGPSFSPVMIITAPTNGTAVINNGGTPIDPTDDTIDYTPNLNYNGPDSIIYQICDSNGDCALATVMLTINPVDDAPVANNDPATVDEDETVNIPVLTNDDFGPDTPSNGPINVTTPPTNGIAVVNDGGTPNDPTDDTVDYTPNPDYSGPDSFVYQICTFNGVCDTATVNVTVTPDNDLPVATNDPATVNEDASVIVTVLTNDTFGPDGPSASAITVTSAPANGTAVVNNGGTPNDPTDDTIVYTPNANYNGLDSFVYQICDSTGDCDTATVNITINPIVDVVDDVRTTIEDIPLVVDVFTNDNDVPTNGTIISSNPPNGTVVITDPNNTPNNPSDDVVTYVPNLDFIGVDTFNYTVCDAAGNCDTAMVTINVTPAPIPDFSPTLFSGNTTVIGASGNIDFRVLVGEYDNADESGSNDVELRILKNDELQISFDNTLTTFNGELVQNSEWVYDGSHPALHKFTYIGNGGIFMANTAKFLGINATYNPAPNTAGTFPLKVTIKYFSGDEINISNNDDIEYINFSNNSNN